MTLSPIEYIGSKPRKPKKRSPLKVMLLVLLFAGVALGGYHFAVPQLMGASSETKKQSIDAIISETLREETTLNTFLKAALNRTKLPISYDPAYYEITYPMGDIPEGKGVCSDLIIRSYREIGIDLQELVIEDMTEHHQSYPSGWELRTPDKNIDHRRVPNLQHYFNRHAESLTISKNATDYKPGDIITWQLSHGAPHIGIVVPSNVIGDDSPWVVHNVGLGPQWENALFRYKITGHYRFKVD